MAAPTGAYVMRNATIAVGTVPVQYANQCTRAELVPDAETQTLRTLVPDGIVQDVDSNVWTLNLAGIQDYTSAVGLARFLTDNHGTEQTITITPKTGGVSAEVTVICKAVPFGGEQGAFATFEVELPVIGEPEFTDPT